MIPEYSACNPLPDVGCPGLWDKLEAILEVALGKTREVFDEANLILGCDDGVDGYVALFTPVLDLNGNHIIVYPEPMQLTTPTKMAKGLMVARDRFNAQVSIIGAFDGYPTVQEDTNGLTVPGPEEVHAASKFVVSVAWCVFCEIWSRLADGTLLGTDTSGVPIDGTIPSFQMLDLDGGQAGFQILISWKED